jgi:hypoxanthine-DNA glycosylase
MGELFGAGAELAYEDRVATLIQSEIAVWDVLASSVRPGSMDSDIDPQTATANDFATLLQQNAGIQLVCFNGQAAAKLFDRLVDEHPRRSFSAVEFVTMPSTSPAYAAMSFAEKLERWSYVAAVLNPVAGAIR